MSDIYQLSQENLSVDMMAQPALIARARQAVANADFEVAKIKEDISLLETQKKRCYAEQYLNLRGSASKITEKEIESNILLDGNYQVIEGRLSNLRRDLIEAERQRDEAKAVFYGIEERGVMLKALSSLEFAEIRQQGRS